MKKAIILLFIFQFQSVFGQKSLEQIINNLSSDENYSSSFSYYDSAEEKQGISIQNETQILEKLNITPLPHKEYSIIGKYEINDLILLFCSEYSVSENTHFAILLDQSFNPIDRLEETAYDNDEGFFGVKSWIDYNVLTIHIHNLYNIPEYLTKKYTITNTGFQPVKNQVIINTPSGIRIRQQPTINSDIAATAPNLKAFDYLSTEPQSDSTAIYDEGKRLENSWLKIAEEDNTRQLGYVFGAFAKRHIEIMTNDYKLVFDEISEEEFQEQKQQNKYQYYVEKTTDIKTIKSILKNQIIEDDVEDDFLVIKKIIADNGKALDTDLEECNLVAYYPDYHYLLLECGHAADYLIDLKNGTDDIDRIGNPDFYLPSPNGRFRLNGYYTGQSFFYFLERDWDDGEPEYMLSLSSVLQVDMLEFFWEEDGTALVRSAGVCYRVTVE